MKACCCGVQSSGLTASSGGAPSDRGGSSVPGGGTHFNRSPVGVTRPNPITHLPSFPHEGEKRDRQAPEGGPPAVACSVVTVTADTRPSGCSLRRTSPHFAPARTH